MKAHTSGFKQNISRFGREIDVKISYTNNGEQIELGSEEINSISPHYEGSILKSVMKQLDIDSNVEIPVGTELNFQFGVKTRSGKNLIDYSMIATPTLQENGYYKIAFPAHGQILNGQFKENIQYTISFNGYRTAIQSGNAGGFNIYYTDGVYDAIRVSTTNPSFKSLTSRANKTISYIDATWGSTNETYIKDLQLEEGTIATEYEEFGAYDYINYGNYIVKSIEKQEDTNSWQITCYDRMLYAMKDYETPIVNNTAITYPITIRDYINALCTHLGLTFKNANDTFANYDKVIEKELYLSETGNSLNFTFRNVLDDIAETTGSTICINDNNELELRYINQTIGKNLLNVKDGNLGYATLNADGTITSNINNSYYSSINTTSLNELLMNNLGNTFTFSIGQSISNSAVEIVIYGTRSNSSTFQSATSSVGAKSISITVANDFTNITQISFRWNRKSAAFTDTTTIVSELMFEEGPQATNYEPYGETINEEFLKDTNVNVGDLNGPVNTIILSRSGNSDKISLSNPIDLPEEQRIAIEIVDNEIMNGNDRADYLAPILTQLNGLTYYSNDMASYGICYLELCDLYNIMIGENVYKCIMLNDEVNINSGVEETFYTDDITTSGEDYKYIGSDDRKIDEAYILVKKNEGEIESVVGRVGKIETKEGNDYQELLNKFQPIDSALTDIDEYKTRTLQLETDTYTKTEIQQIANGTGVGGVKVSAVITTSGKFNENGMTYEKTNAPTKSTINEIGVNVKDKNDSSLLFAGYVDTYNAPQDLLNKYGDYANQTIVGTDNIIVNNYLNIGTHSRIQNYGNGTGIFWR